jgi:hypothetical protein
MNKQQYTYDGVQYEYQGVSLTSVMPLVGPVDGGTLVFINGSNFHPMDVKGLYCTFGVSLKVNASFQSTEEVACMSPSYFEAGPISIVLTNNDGMYTSTVVFRYHSNPSVRSFAPLVGPLTGGSVVVASLHPT